MSTGFSAVRSGIVMFTIPFVFAFYPELLLIDQALIDPTSPSRAPLPGYENGVSWTALGWLLARLVLSLYLVASALAGFDAKRLMSVEIVLRIAIAVAVLARPELIHFTAIAAAFALIGWHYFRARRSAAAST